MTTLDDIFKIIISITGVFISAFCSYYVYTKLKLKKVIKGQLLGMTIHHLLAYLQSIGAPRTGALALRCGE